MFQLARRACPARPRSEIGAELSQPLGHVPLVHDRVASVHGFCLVAGDLHRDRTRNTRAFEIPYGGTAEVVEQTTGAAGLPAGLSPRGVDRADFPSPAMEYPGDDALTLALEPKRPLPLHTNQLPEFRERPERENSTVVVLRRSYFEADHLGMKVDLAPPERKDLSETPARQVTELGDGPQPLGEVSGDSLEFVALEESRTGVLYLDRREVRNGPDLSPSVSEAKRAPERDQLVSNGRWRHSVSKPPGGVALNPVGGDVDRERTAK